MHLFNYQTMFLFIETVKLPSGVQYNVQYNEYCDQLGVVWGNFNPLRYGRIWQ